MRNTFLAIASVATFALTATSATAAVITYNAAPEGFASAPFVEAGFTTTFIGGDGFFATTFNCSPTCADNGTRYALTLDSYGNGFYAETIRIAAVGGGGFTFAGFDGAENPFAGNAGNDWAKGVTVVGTRPDSSTFTQTFLFDGINDGAGGLADFQPFVSGSFFDVFVQLDFTGVIDPVTGGRDFSIDNVSLSPAVAPEPVAAILLGLGIAAMARRRIRRAV